MTPRDSGCRRSSESDRLSQFMLVWTPERCGPILPSRNGVMFRSESGWSELSMPTTSAPKSVRYRTAAGPASTQVKSRTFSPVSGRVAGAARDMGSADIAARSRSCNDSSSRISAVCSPTRGGGRL